MDTAEPTQVAASERTDIADFKLSHLYWIIIVGIFATTLAQPQVLGNLPLKFLLKNELHVSKTSMSSFFFLVALPWYFKPFAGVLTDAFPLFGTRRRWYLILSGVCAFFCWLLIGLLPHTYNLLLGGCILLSVFMVMASTVTGAFLVETGQHLKATGRLTALRQFVQNFCSMIQGPVGGKLVHYGLLSAALINGAMAATIAPVAYIFLRERPHHVGNAQAIRNAGEQIRTIFSSRPLWWALLFILLFYFSPGFNTPLLYRQTDELKFSSDFIGWLGTFGGAAGLLAAVLYGFLIKRVQLKTMLFVSVLCAGLGTLFYLFYNSADAARLIDTQNGFFFGLAEVALIDLAARATPKGCEGFGYGLILSLRNVANQGADLIGSKLSDAKVPFHDLVYLNAGTTLIVLILLPFLPAILTRSKDAPVPDES